MRDDGIRYSDTESFPVGVSEEELKLAVMQSAARSFHDMCKAEFGVDLEPPQQGNGFLYLFGTQHGDDRTFFIMAPRRFPTRSLRVLVADGRCIEPPKQPKAVIKLVPKWYKRYASVN
jgi:hypothetical protein